jgi:hypothetical protein
VNRRRRLGSIGGALWLFTAASGAAPSDEVDEQALFAAPTMWQGCPR